MRITQHILYIQNIAHVFKHRPCRPQCGLWYTLRVLLRVISIFSCTFQKRSIIKGEALSDGSKDHFYGNYQILSEISRFSIEKVHFQKYCEDAGLPKREEKDGFDAEELRKGRKWLQTFLRCHIEENQAVERERY